MSRAQALEHGVTDGQIKAMLIGRRWCTHLPGSYLTFTGPVPPRTRVWGALLYAGEGAIASLATAAWLWGYAATCLRLSRSACRLGAR